MINEEVRQALEVELLPDETLIWADRPAKRPYPWRGVWRAGFWCFWMLFVCYWLLGVINEADFVSVQLKILFLIVGFVCLFFGFAIRKTYLKGLFGPKHEIYGLTNKRAIVLSPLWKEKKFINMRGQDHSRNHVEANELDTINVELFDNDTIGTIIFSGWWDRVRYSWYVFPNPESPKILSNLNGFRNINNPVSVANMFRDTFGTNIMSSSAHIQSQTRIPEQIKERREEPLKQKITEAKRRRVVLFSIFPSIWILFTLLVGPSGWLFLSFITFPFFIASAFHAVREFIRPEHSYRISS